MYIHTVLLPGGIHHYLLINLSRMEKANLTQWAQRVGLDRTTMVRNVKNLESKGLVALTSGSGRTFTLTERGRSVLAHGVTLWEDAQARLREKLGPADADALLRICRKLQAPD